MKAPQSRRQTAKSTRTVAREIEFAFGSMPHLVNATALKERMLVRADLLDHDAQLRNFTLLRDRLVASGHDAKAKYLEIQAERDRLWAKWKKLAHPPAPSRNPALPGDVMSLPIAALRLKLLAPGVLGPWFGYSGSVVMGQAQEGENVIPSGGSGSISTIPDGLLSNGSILFTGDIVSSGKAVIWLHNWKYLIILPAPVVTSVITYSFGVGVQVTLWGGHGSATFVSWVSLGETANFTGQDITVNNDGFPLVAANLSEPSIRGVLNVQRSFLVGAGETPAIGVVFGVATALSPNSEIFFSPGRDCFICPAATIDPATAVGPRAERGFVNFHYQPLPPEALP